MKPRSEPGGGIRRGTRREAETLRKRLRELTNAVVRHVEEMDRLAERAAAATGPLEELRITISEAAGEVERSTRELEWTNDAARAALGDRTHDSSGRRIR